MKVLFIIDYYMTTAGASSAMRGLILGNSQLDNPVVFCRKNFSKDDICKIPIIEADGEQVIKYYIEHNYQVIHYIRADGWGLFYEIVGIIKKRNLQIPIVTTVCQQPEIKQYLYRPFEIDNADKIVFIDKTAYNSPLYKSIPYTKKEMIYFALTKKEDKDAYKIYDDLSAQYLRHNDCLVIGRASTLNKCPANMFEVFDKIDYPKKFVIMGDGNKEWILAEASKRDYEVTVKDGASYNEFLKVLNTFDIFLYHLPMDAHSSLDGTLHAAMLLKKPVVYMGPGAPKERFHGKEYNGFVADNVDEAAMYVNRLMHNPELCKIMGQRAHDTTIEDFDGAKTFASYNRIYQELITNGKHPGGAPLNLKWFYFWNFVYPQKVAVIKAEVKHNTKKILIALGLNFIVVLYKRIKKTGN